MKADVVPATQALLEGMIGRFRKVDVEEVYAMSGRDINEAAREGVRYSEKSWIGLWGSDPIVVFGVRRLSLLSDEGTPWLLGTDRIKEPGIKKAFIEGSVPFVLEMLRYFKYLENFVDARNTTSIRWLKLCGFTVEKPEPMGLLQMPFHRFWLRR